MEIRRTYAGSTVPKGLMVLLAVCAAVALAGAAGIVTKNLSGSGASTQSIVHPAAGTVLRQDNPAQQAAAIAAGQHGARTTGNQVVNDNLSDSSYGSDSDLTRVLPSKPAAYDPGWDARSVREGHGA